MYLMHRLHSNNIYNSSFRGYTETSLSCQQCNVSRDISAGVMERDQSGGGRQVIYWDISSNVGFILRNCSWSQLLRRRVYKNHVTPSQTKSKRATVYVRVSYLEVTANLLVRIFSKAALAFSAMFWPTSAICSPSWENLRSMVSSWASADMRAMDAES